MMEESLSKSIRTNSQQESDINYAVRVSRFTLRIIGAWPIPKSASKAERIVTRLQIVACYFLFAFTIVPGLLMVILKEHDLKRRVRLLGPIMNCWMRLVKYSILVYHAKKIRSCLEQLRQDWRDTVDGNDREVMLYGARIGRKFALISAVLTYGGGLFFRTVMPLSKGRILTPMNTTVRLLPCPSYFVNFDEQASPAYEIVFTLQFFAGFVTYSVWCGTAGLSALFIMHVCGRLGVLIGKIQHLNSVLEPEDQTFALLFADIVEHQIKVKSFVKQLEDALRYVWLIEIGGCTILICVAGYYVIMEWETSNSTGLLTISVMLSSLIVSIFTICYVGQLVTDQSIKVGLMTTTTNWYRLPHKRARALILIIAISNIPTRITAGKIIEMSLPTFGNIMKTSLAYFNLLRKFV